MEGVRLLCAPGEPLLEGAIEVADGCITALGPNLPPDAQITSLDRTGMLVIPGFVQGHIHLCQSLFQGLAEGRRLDRWLRERIWPLEAALDEESLRAAARWGIAQTLLHGGTTILDMGTVHDTDVIAETAREMGVRIILGKALMDAGDGVPPALTQPPETAFREALALHDRWHGSADGRLQVSFAPRFTLSVSGALWRQLAAEARRRGMLVHTHASETPWENERCREMHGLTPVRALAEWGVFDAPSVLVHTVCIDEEEIDLLAGHGVGVIHCPGSNAKLGSGTAPAWRLHAAGVAVGLGADGVACNDQLSVPAEMRLAAQLQSLREGPGVLSAREVFAWATDRGAAAVNLGDRIGRLAVGRRADLLLFREAELPWPPDLPREQGFVYASAGLRPAEVIVDGRQLVAGGELLTGDLSTIRREAAQQRQRLLARLERKEAQWEFPAN
ncbi:MAG: amidohydrolase family protein [Candidatus Eisenbacteria sp.]|nr:amidohydrolase family protein [Candidatus Eisenbacteria bacterium]